MMSEVSSKGSGKKAPVFKFFVGSKSKVRTGCTTCKIRRIKCDEKKPACNRCTSTGRHCDGYPELQTRKRHNKKSGPKTSPELLNPATTDRTAMMSLSKRKVQTSLPIYPECSPQETRLLHIFLNHSIEIMSPWHGGNFWEDHVPRRGHFELATRHAMISMAATHENMQFMRDAIPNDPRMEDSVVKARKNFALYHYAKSISELARLLSNRQAGAEEIAMINCVIYIVVDFLWGNVATSITHLHSGNEILKQWKKKQPKKRLIEEGSLEANFIRVYETMNHQVTEGAVKEGSGTDSSDSELADFDNFTDARNSIEKLASEGLRLVRQSSLENDDNATAERRAELQKGESVHKGRLEVWRARFEGLLAKSEHNGSKNNKQIKEDISTMLLLYLAAIVWVWDGAYPKQPQPLKLFGQLIHVSELLLAESKDSVEDRNRIRKLLFDTRIWPSVAILAAKCEDLDLRKRAVAILAKTRPNNVPTSRENTPPSTSSKAKTNSSREDFEDESAGNWSTWVEMSTGQ